MHTAVPASASGSGFLSNTAALAAFLLLIVVVAALPTCKSALSGHLEQFRSYFFGPGTPDGGDEPPTGEPDAPVAEEPSTDETPKGRASDRETFDFDLNVFSDLFGGPVDVPPQER